MRTFFKDPGDTTDWVFDWSTYLGTGETVSTSTITADAGITVGNGSNGAPAPSHDGTSATFWLIGGSDGQRYKLTNIITTSAGRTVERSIYVQVTVR